MLEEHLIRLERSADAVSDLYNAVQKMLADIHTEIREIRAESSRGSADYAGCEPVAGQLHLQFGDGRQLEFDLAPAGAADEEDA